MHPTQNKHSPKTPPSGNARTDDRRKPDADTSESRKNGVQGEGNYDAAREFNEAERRFVESGKVPAAARAAAPKSEAEQQEMIAAEQEGKRRAHKEHPAPGKASPKSEKTLTVRGKDANGKRG